MEDDDKKSPEKTPPPEAKPAAVKHARPKLSEDRLKGADGKDIVPQRTYNYGSKSQLIVMGILGVIVLALFVFMKLHPRHPAKKATPAEVPAATMVTPAPEIAPPKTAPKNQPPSFQFQPDP